MTNKSLLLIIAILLFGVFSVVVIDAMHQSPEEEIANSFTEMTEEISDSIADGTKGS